MSTINNVNKLPVVKADEYKEIRDIVIPVKIKGRGDSAQVTMDEECIKNAIAYIGEVTTRRIYDETNPNPAQDLLSILEAVTDPIKNGERSFHIEHKGKAFRAQVGIRPNGSDVTLRVIPDTTPHLNDLKMPEAWREFLLSNELLNGGMVIISGQNGNGKTTTAAAIVRSRLERWGGHCNTAEDPVELPLDGPWVGPDNAGYCTQRPANLLGDHKDPGSGYRRALYEAARQFPSFTGGGTILLIGEIRDEDTALAAINGAIAGHLVIATVHAPSAVGAIARMVSLASMKAGIDPAAIREQLSAQLITVLHQRLAYIDKAEDRSGGHWQHAEVRGEVLFRDSNGSDSNSKVGNAIIKGAPGEGALQKYSAEQTSKINQLTGDRAKWAAVKVLLNNLS